MEQPETTCAGSVGYTVRVWQDLIDHLEDPHGIVSTGHPSKDLAAHEQDHLQLDYPHSHGREVPNGN